MPRFLVPQVRSQASDDVPRTQAGYIVHHVDDVTAVERAKRRIRALAEISANKERLAAVGALIGSVLGKATSPLAVIETSAYLASRHRNAPAKADKHLARIGEQMRLASPIFHEVAGLARESLPPNDEISLTAELAQIIEELERLDDALSLSVSSDPGGSRPGGVLSRAQAK